jgi:sugar-specific transcriptional regulator TrmB
MDTERLHEALTRAGLTEYQAQAYLALLEIGSGPVVDVAERTDIPGSQVYEVVRSLEDEGFVETIERDQLHARAREPVEIQTELRQTGDLLTDAADAIEDRWESPSPEQHRVSVVKRKATVLERTRDAIADAEVAAELAVTADQFRSIRPTLEAAADRGVVLHVAINGPLDGLDEEIADSGIREIRHSVTPGSLLAIVDRRLSSVSPNYHHDEEYGVLVDDQILSFMLHWTFLTTGWAPCETVHTAGDGETFISIEGFVQRVADRWHDGAAVDVSITGRDTDSGERVDVEGDIAYISIEGGTPPPRNPRYEHLGGNVTLVVDTGDDYVTVGGWGAIYEDVEAQVVRINAIDDAAVDGPYSPRFS